MDDLARYFTNAGVYLNDDFIKEEQDYYTNYLFVKSDGAIERPMQ